MLGRASTLVALALLSGVAPACDGCRHAPSAADSIADAAAQRSPEEIRKNGNHLVGQASLYLTQHAHNPVDWYPWTPEALARAKELGRPVFLSVGYASCHWCHVMEAEVFESDEVAEVLNAGFVAIKVDREERPDIDATYMDALQAMTGSGGWPASLFLTPELEPFFGATYMPKARFLDVARNVLKEFKESRASLAQQGAELRDRIAEHHAIAGKPEDKLRPTEIEAMARRSLDGFDEESGGFRGRTKFPSAATWTFLLHAARKSGEVALIAPLRKTLDAMAQGGLFDQVGGGFFRYTTEPTWTVPHFEKMLYTNASLARLYLEAYAAFGEARDLRAASQTLDFLLREMADPEGGFYASLDADSGGKEGAFYVFTAAELRALLGDADGTAAAKAFGATEPGNFEGANVLTLRDTVDAKKLESWRSRLLAAREGRVRPRRDEKIVTAWNGLVIDALARGFAATRDVRYRDAARRTADRLWEAHRPQRRLVRTSTAGKTSGDAELDDYAAFAAGLLSLYDATGDVSAVVRALDLTEEAQRDFAHPSGAFFSARAAQTGPLERRIEPFDGEEPCGQSVTISNLVRLAALTGRPAFYEALERALTANAKTARAAGRSMASFLDAAMLDAGPFYDVVIAGDSGPQTVALDEAWRPIAPSWAVHTDVQGNGPSPLQLRVLPPTEGKLARNGAPTAYVCVRGACGEPTGDAAKLKAQLLQGWSK